MKSAKRFAPLLVLMTCLAAVVLVRAPLLDTVLRRVLIPAVEQRLPGLKLSYAGLGMHGLTRLRLNGIDISYCLEGDCLRLTVPEAVLSSPLSGLLPWRGAGAFLRQSALEARGAEVSGVLPAAFFSPDTPYVFPAPPSLPALTVADSALDLSVQGVGIKAQGLALSAPSFVADPDTSYQAQVNAASLALNHPGWPARQGSLAATVRYRAGRLEVPTLSFDKALLLEGVGLDADAAGLHYAMKLHLLGSQGLVRGEIGLRSASLSFHLDEADLKALSGAAGVTAPVGGHLRADGEMKMDLGRIETLKGTAQASVRDGSWQGVPVERFTIGLRAEDQKLLVDSLEMVIAKNRITVRDGLVPIPEPPRTWFSALAKGRAAVELELTDMAALPPSWSAWFLKDWQALGISSLSAALTLADGHLLLPKAEAAGRAGRVWATDGKVDLGAAFSDWRALPWSVNWRAELTDAAVIQHFWEPWPATEGTVSGQGSFSGSLAEPHLPFSATFKQSKLYGVPLAKVAGDVVWSKDRLALDVKAESGARDWLTFKGDIDLAEGGLLATKVAIDVADAAPYLPPGRIAALRLSGPLAGTSALAGPFSALVGELQLKGDWLARGVKLSSSTVDAAFNKGKWSLRRLETTLDSGLRVAGSGKMEPSAGWRRFAVGVDDLRLDYGGQRLALVQPGGLRLSAEQIAVTTPLAWAGDLGRFRLEGQLGGSGGPLRLIGEGVRDTGLLRQASGKEIGFAGLDFTLEMSGALTHPAYGGQGRATGLTAVGEEFLKLSGVFDLTYDERGLWFKKFDWTDADQSISLAGHLPLRHADGATRFLPYPLDLKAKVSLPHGGLLPRLFPDWLAASRAVEADLSLGGTWEMPRGQIRFTGDGLRPGARLAGLPAGPYAASGDLSVEKNEVTITRFEAASPELTVQAAGSVKQLPLALLMAGQFSADAAQLGLQGRFASTNLGWLAAKIPGLVRTAGSANGSFSLNGPLAGPQARAELSLKNGQARGGDSLLVARDMALEAALDHDNLTITNFSGTLGGSPVSGAGTVKGLLTPERQLDLRLTGKDLLLYRADGVKLRADTRLELTGTGKAPRLTGELLFTDSRITKKVNWLSFLKPGAVNSGDSAFALFSFKDEPLKSTRLNLRLQAAKPLAVANNVFKGDVRPDLTLAGTGELPSLAGVVYVDNGRLTLPSGRMDMESSLVRFNEDEPERPRLQMQATGRMMGYDITARLTGPYDEPEVSLSSVPPLANEDLLMLMLTGRQPLATSQTANNGLAKTGAVYPGSGTAAANGTASTNVAVYLGRGVLSRVFGDEEDEFQLLDRLELDIGRAVTQQGEETVEARFRLADRFWKSDTSLYLTADKDIWDYYNGGLRVVFHLQ